MSIFELTLLGVSLIVVGVAMVIWASSSEGDRRRSEGSTTQAELDAFQRVNRVRDLTHAAETYMDQFVAEHRARQRLDGSGVINGGINNVQQP